MPEDKKQNQWDQNGRQGRPERAKIQDRHEEGPNSGRPDQPQTEHVPERTAAEYAPERTTADHTPERAQKGHVILEIKNLKVNFLAGKRSINAIREVTLSAAAGETLGIVGESGCGKSLTATSVMRLLPKETARIESGEILFEGKDLLKLSDKEMDKIRGNEISMIFQDPMTSLNPVYKIGRQLMELVLAHRKIRKDEAWELCVQMLAKVGIPAPRERMEKYPHELSGGMRQRVMIAMALLGNPKVLIADEPTTALDVTIQAQILDLILDIQEETKTAVILITHDMGVIAETADNVAVMYAGEIVEYDSVEGIFNRAMHPYTLGLLRSIPRFDKDVDRLETIEGIVPSLGNMPEGCRFCTRCPYAVEKCRNMTPKLTAVGAGKLVRCHRVSFQAGFDF